MQPRLEGRRIAVLVADGFEDLEFWVPGKGNVVRGRVVEDIPDFCRELVDATADAPQTSR